MTISKYWQGPASAVAAAILITLSSQAGAAPLALSDSPLFLTASVKPNLIMAIDDSGSMDFELLLRGNDGAAWWRTTQDDSGDCLRGSGNSFTGCISNPTGTRDVRGDGQLNFNNAGNSSTTWKKFAYLFPNGSGDDTSDRRRLTDGDNDHYALPPFPAYAWSRSPDYNAAYFNPLTAYKEWPSGGGLNFGPASPTGARFDPVFMGAPTIDLTKDRAGTGSVATDAACNSNLPAPEDNHYFRVYTGMTIPADTCIRVKDAPRSGGGSRFNTWATTLSDVAVGASQSNSAVPNNASVAIRYFPATFYLKASTATGINYTGTPAAVGKAPDGTTLYRYEIRRTNFADTPSYTAAIQNFANWFSYYRKRHQALRAGLGTAFLTVAGIRVSGFTINQSGQPSRPDVTMGDIDDAGTRDALYTNFYKDWVHSGGTPNRAAVANLIRNYKRTGANAPVQKSCQRNFGMLFTDGFSNPPDTNDGINVGGADAGEKAPYQDDVDNTLADAVLKAYKGPLRSDLTGSPASVPAACSNNPVAPGLDCNPVNHMNFYAVTLGTRGLQFNPDNPVDPYLNPPTWPTTFPARHPSAVDDIWHATINGRGQLLNAKSSSELAAKLSAVVGDIAASAGSASSASASSGSIRTDTRVFQASFDSTDWSGDLQALPIDQDGNLGTPVSATFPTTREIMTVNSTGSPVSFAWANLDATRKSQLNATDSLGEKRVSYLRGSQAEEKPRGVNFRVRSSPNLGDVLNSAPAFVGAPAFRYPENLEKKSYAAFRAANVTREHMVYVGANDGMLHAFSSNDSSKTGAVFERFAFIPGAVFKNLYKLSDPSYTHLYYVDGTPTTGDAFINGDWRTLLVAGLNKGGQSVYALDITDPSVLKGNASGTSVLKWEFDDADDIDMGFSYSRPSIVRMANGKWAAVFGNGYNNTFADGRASTTGNAVLYVVDLASGSLLAKIDTGVGMSADATGRPNGLSTPVMADLNGDGIVDLGYAGDLQGNVWKFDFSSSTAANWKIPNSTPGRPATPFFTAKDSSDKPQPITVRPSVARGPGGQGVIVLFGTGKYLEVGDSDVSMATTQSFYGLLDPNGGTASDVISGRSLLTQQTITDEGLYKSGSMSFGVRVTSNNTLNSTSRGWYLDLISPKNTKGERQVTDAVIRDGHILYTTLIPSDDPCMNGGTSWLMEMSLFTGSRLDNSPFDLNNDGKFDDTYSQDGKPDQPFNGVQNDNGGNPKPELVDGSKCLYILLPGTEGGTKKRCVDPGPRGFGRQSWRQSR